MSRTADDLVRYHGKMMIVDGRMLHVYGFNFTALDIDKSRSFGVDHQEPAAGAGSGQAVRGRLQPPAVCSRATSVSSSAPKTPASASAQFIRAREAPAPDLRSAAHRRRDAADPRAKAKAGVDVRVIGKVEAKWDAQGREARAGACTCARSSATARARSSAARACASSSSKSAAKSASSSTTARSCARWTRSSRRTGRRPKPARRRRRKSSPPRR